jgi:flagellar hook assembly protein FlgD
LSQNYPNPFNPETNIEYALPRDTDVKLTIYNILGERIKVLVDEHQTAGYKRVYWNGTDQKGEDVASGSYFYRLETKGFSKVKKMMLVK